LWSEGIAFTVQLIIISVDGERDGVFFGRFITAFVMIASTFLEKRTFLCTVSYDV
jgi:hypothetical protein